MIDVNVVTLENDQEYLIVDAIEVDNNNYLVLAKEDSIGDFCIRKVISKDGKEYMVKLDTKEEFDRVLNEFVKKHSKKGDENE